MDNTISGLGVSKGTAEGKAKYGDDPTFQEGDILVTSLTTPDVVPVMKLAAAIVTEIGSITCHAAIVARELGKPCVVRTNTPSSKLVGSTVLVTVNAIKEATVQW